MFVGALGFVVQWLALWALITFAHWPWLPATIVAVQLAVVHNFLWHERWTWKDRGLRNASAFRRLLRFNVANGLTSIVSNVALMSLLVGVMDVPPILANAIAVGISSLANFLAADRWVFKSAAVAFFMSVPLNAASVEAATLPDARTIVAWKAYVADTETRLERTRSSPRDAPPEPLVADGISVDIAGGTISHWRGAAFIRGITLDRLLDGLQHPGTPPPQDDVAAAHVIGRSADSLCVAIRLVRHALVTVTYDTEHEMTFRRWTPRLATARSVSTSVEEVGGGDHGFLWRLNSYWRYEERSGGVFVELESLTLSRDIPSWLRPIASPLVRRIAKESMERTLIALRRQYQSG
jgi:putative flippase GtrA